MSRRQSLAAWIRSKVVPSDGPDAGRPLRLEPWQRGLLDAIDRERRPIIAVRAASQLGKTLLMVGVGLRAAVDGRGTILATSTEKGSRDLARRLDSHLDASAALQEHFPFVRTGPNSKAGWADRRTPSNGWLSLAHAGSPSALASRTAAVAVCDEISRWPARVRGSEGSPLSLIRARLFDWGDAGRLLAISSPTVRGDAIDRLFRSGDRRRPEYTCPACGERTSLAWERVTGREKGETPAVACEHCGALHDERARRRMLRSAKWVAQRTEPDDEDYASFALSRLDSARASLGQVVREWRRARRAVETGDPLALRAFRNTVLGLPSESGAADVDKLYEQRGRQLDTPLEQVTAGVDVQADRLVFVRLGFTAGNLAAVVLDYGVILGDPTGDEPWRALESRITAGPGLPVSVVSVDAGYLTSNVVAQCRRRRWWLATVGRAGEGKPIARPMPQSGICTMGADSAAGWWSARVNTGAVYLPADITRAEVGELCAAEALTAEATGLHWRPVDHRENHYWDGAKLATHARHFRPLAAAPARPRLYAVR